MVRYTLYGGKGGVGKTTCAAATGLALAESGEETLVVSTDPAHSLADVLDADVGGDPREVSDGLWAVEVDPASRQEIYEEMLGALAAELRSVGIRLTDEDVEDLFAAGVAPGGDEVAALDSFAEYVDADQWDRVVFDTAPTGHTLRLLELPEVVATAAEKALSVRSQVRRMADSARSLVFGPMAYVGGRDADEDEFTALKARMERVAAILRDPEMTTFRVVLVPEAMAISESRRLVARLHDVGVPVEAAVVNRVLADVDESCARCTARRDRHRERVAEVRETFPDLELYRVPELDGEARGLEALEQVAASLPRD